MLSAFDRSGRKAELPASGRAREAGDAVVWIDLHSPEPEERRRVEAFLGVSLPSRDELKDIEPSSRQYVENGVLYLTGSLVWRVETDFATIAEVGFVLAGDTLVTIRYADPRAFRLFQSSLARPEACGETGLIVLSKLLETIVDRTAEILEYTSARADELSLKIFGSGVADRNHERASHNLEADLAAIATFQRLNAKTRDSLLSLGRLTSFLSAFPAAGKVKEVKERCKLIARDIRSLSEHADFVGADIIFLLDACLGLINVQQNAIIKILSVAAVVLLPPTFIGTIYGMNFRHMPELDWTYGYPAALAAMIVVAVAPYLWFRRRGWL